VYINRLNRALLEKLTIESLKIYDKLNRLIEREL
jgi:hypothetical protein